VLTAELGCYLRSKTRGMLEGSPGVGLQAMAA
jgi:hypothetical protein